MDVIGKLSRQKHEITCSALYGRTHNYHLLIAKPSDTISILIYSATCFNVNIFCEKILVWKNEHRIHDFQDGLSYLNSVIFVIVIGS